MADRGLRRWMRKMIRAALVVIALAGPALSAPPCGDRNRVVAVLADRYGEHQAGFGIADRGVIMEVWAGASGSWTLLLTLPDGQTCIVAVGTRYQDHNPNL